MSSLHCFAKTTRTKPLHFFSLKHLLFCNLFLAGFCESLILRPPVFTLQLHLGAHLSPLFFFSNPTNKSLHHPVSSLNRIPFLYYQLLSFLILLFISSLLHLNLSSSHLFFIPSSLDHLVSSVDHYVSSLDHLINSLDHSVSSLDHFIVS